MRAATGPRRARPARLLGWAALLAGILTLLLAFVHSSGPILASGLVIAAIATAHLANSTR